MNFKCKNCSEPTKIIKISKNDLGWWYTCDCCGSTFLTRGE